MEQTQHVTKPQISKEEFNAWVDAGLVDKDDVRKITLLTQQAKMNDGQGYGFSMVTAVVRREYTTTQQLVNLVRNYYAQKKLMLDNTLRLATQEA